MTKKQKKMLFRIITGAVLTMFFYHLDIRETSEVFLYLIPYFVVGYDILIKAVKGIINKQVLDENFLMAIATVGAIIIGILKTGDYTEAVAVMLFYQTGELFQSYAVGKSRKNISELMDIRPDFANIEKDGKIFRVDPYEVGIGDMIIVNPGEKIPLDGVVVEGTSSLNTGALTGESVPKDVQPGKTVISGCINMSGVLKIKTTKEFDESTVMRILELVENASFKKARSENFISRFAKVYTPFVCIGALFLAVLPPLVEGMIMDGAIAWSEWIYRALTFLVISCPCALVISIPLSFFAGIGGAGSAGILVKGANYLEALSKVKTVVFDKTGTLTEGVFEVGSIYAENISEEELLEYATFAECASSHPISKSLKTAYKKDVDISAVDCIREFSGKGVTACVRGREVCVGNGKLMEQEGISFHKCEKPGTVVYIGIDGRFAGYILISDKLKKTSESGIRSLKKLGVRNIIMLTGDNKKSAEIIAESLGIDNVFSELLPDGKVREVEGLLEVKKKKEVLAFVGDGINDAPVLSRADIGIAMGAMGSDAAIEAADVVLMDDNPEKIAVAIRISKKCMTIVYQNIVFAIGIKIICLMFGALGFAGLWAAIFADVGVMVLAVLNAMRMLFVKRI